MSPIHELPIRREPPAEAMVPLPFCPLPRGLTLGWGQSKFTRHRSPSAGYCINHLFYADSKFLDLYRDVPSNSKTLGKNTNVCQYYKINAYIYRMIVFLMHGFIGIDSSFSRCKLALQNGAQGF